jgi:hypothetical protein
LLSRIGSSVANCFQIAFSVVRVLESTAMVTHSH